MVWMECAIWELANLLKLKKFSFPCEMVKFKVSDSQNFGRGKGACYQFYSEICGSQEQMGVTGRFFENSKAKDQTRFAPLSQTKCSKMKI